MYFTKFHSGNARGPEKAPRPAISRPATGRLSRRTDGSTVTNRSDIKTIPEIFHLTNQLRRLTLYQQYPTLLLLK